MSDFSRRTFLGHTLCGAAAAMSPLGLSRAFGASRSEVSATPLADGLALLTGAGANVVAARGADGLLLVDGGLEERSSDLLKVAFKELGARHAQILFNTHWHPEQTGSNQRLGKGGAKIVAHENTKLWLSRKINVSWREKSFGPLPDVARPTETIYTSAQMEFGGERIEYGYLLQAHTDGDIYVFFRNANVLVAGGAVTGDQWPMIDWQTGGWIGGMAAGLSKLIALCDERTRIVPANGPLLTRADLETQREMYRKIYERLVKSLTSGLGPDEVVASAPTREFNPQWGDPSAFVAMAFRSLWPHFAPDA
jgi:cyclase